MAVNSHVRDAVIVGGCGRVGLPLAAAFASRGLAVTVYDRDAAAVAQVQKGLTPYMDEAVSEILPSLVASGALVATTDPAALSSASNVVFAVGLSISGRSVALQDNAQAVVAECRPWLRSGQLLVLRSTLHPGTMRSIERLLESGPEVDLAFCPERTAEGLALAELLSLPQIVAARTTPARERATSLFSVITTHIVDLDPEEAELAKLFGNAWRYIQFAAANQFWAMAEAAGLDWPRIRHAMTHDYPRGAQVPTAGLCGGPCLPKDTLHLVEFSAGAFSLGTAAHVVNESVPGLVIAQAENAADLSRATVGILGMAFKGGVDDVRGSLSYRLRNLLRLKAKEVICSDPHVNDAGLVDLDEVIKRSDVVIIAAPHPEYAGLDLDIPVIDIWEILGREWHDAA